MTTESFAYWIDYVAHDLGLVGWRQGGEPPRMIGYQPTIKTLQLPVNLGIIPPLVNVTWGIVSHHLDFRNKVEVA